MSKIFIRFAFRNILKNRLSSLINLMGFSIGITVCLFIFLFIRYEMSYDKFYPEGDRIYRLVGGFQSKGNISKSGFTWFPAAPEIKKEIPGVEDFCRVSDVNSIKCYQGNQIHDIRKFRFADENFFQFFNYKLLIGNNKTALNSANNIVLTEKKAYELFGSENPIGQTLKYNHELFTVTGIVSSLPGNTHLDFDAIASIKYIEQNASFWKGWGGGITFLSYLLLSEGIVPQQIEAALPSFLDNKVNNEWKSRGLKLSLSLQNIRDVHIADGSIQSDCSSNRSKNSIYIVTSICFFILFLVIVNYIILYTSQKVNRIKDIGILKLQGAKTNGLMIQTFIEVFIISLVSSLSGIIILGVSLDFFNSQLKTSVSLQDNIFEIIPFIILITALLSVIITFFSTNRIITSKTIDIIKNKIQTGNSKQIQGNYLVAIQFTIVLLLLISVIVVKQQNNYLLNRELGFNKENILIISSDEEFVNNELDGIKQELKKIPSVHSVSLSSQIVGQGLTQNGYTFEGEQELSMVNVLYTDNEFLDCFDIHILEGRNFNQNGKIEENSILVNKQLVNSKGWKEPLAKRIERDGLLEVIGVVDNFNFASLENDLRPLIIMANPNWDGWGYSVVNIRFQTSDIQGLIKQIDGVWKKRFPETPYQISFLDELLNNNYESLTEQKSLVNFFSFLASFISIIGLFGLTVFNTRKRNKEIGVRKVNGAKSIEIVTMLNKVIIKWVFIAFIVATPIAWFILDKWLENFAYKTDLSWWMFVLAGIFVFIIAILTTSWQTWMAARRNPVEALRYE